jgi:hypothetical protein
MVTDPSLRTPSDWLLISESIDRHAQALVFADRVKDEYIHVTAKYMPASNERFNGIKEGNVLDKHLLPLLFLVKRSSRAHSLIDIIPDTFSAPDLPLYTKAGMYREHDLSLSPSELRLEFYGRVLKMFSSPGDRYLSIMGGTKPMLAGIVSFPIIVSCSSISFILFFLARLELKVGFSIPFEFALFLFFHFHLKITFFHACADVSAFDTHCFRQG